MKEILIVRISDIMEAFINIFTHGCLTNEKRAVPYWHIYHSLSLLGSFLPVPQLPFASRGDTQQSRRRKIEPLNPEIGASHYTFALSQHDSGCVQSIPLCVCLDPASNVAAHFTFPPADSLRNVFRGKFLPSENFIRMTNGALP